VFRRRFSLTLLTQTKAAIEVYRLRRRCARCVSREEIAKSAWLTSVNRQAM